jgi:hypothetical protein
MDPVDGNAIGGLLIDVFGTETTGATLVCATCGSEGPAAQLVVYRQGPGVVARCRACSNLMMVFVRMHGMTCTDVSGVADMR